MYVRVWQYEVPAEQVEAFVAAYGADGDWAQLFRRASGYAGTDLFRDTDSRDRFLTVDRWDSETAWDAFLAQRGTEYGRLADDLAGLTTANRPVLEGDT